MTRFHKSLALAALWLGAVALLEHLGPGFSIIAGALKGLAIGLASSFLIREWEQGQ